MQVSEHVHAIRVPFAIPLGPGRRLDRFVWVYLVCGRRIWVIDAGVAGCWTLLREYLEKIGRRPAEVECCVFTHAHPDHIGGARSLHAATGCRFAAHGGDRAWIEDVDLEARERPVPGFAGLVEGSVRVDVVLADGQRLSADESQSLTVLHTPGHSLGHVALLHEPDRVLFSGDCLVTPDSMPIYDDVLALVQSIRKLAALKNVAILLSSMDASSIAGRGLAERCEEALGYIRKVHEAVVVAADERPDGELSELTADVVQRLGLPPLAANPVSARSVAAHLRTMDEGLRIL